MDLREEAQSEKLREELIALSRDWERENSCRGYRTNGPEDLEGRRIFCAREDGVLTGYLFGRVGSCISISRSWAWTSGPRGCSKRSRADRRISP